MVLLNRDSMCKFYHIVRNNVSKIIIYEYGTFILLDIQYMMVKYTHTKTHTRTQIHTHTHIHTHANTQTYT